MRRVWADTILAAEQQHLLRMLIWAALSIVAGTAIVTLLTVRRTESALLAHFAYQTAAWGVVVGAVAAVSWHSLRLRDLAGAARLEHLVWLNVGLAVAYAAAGAVLAVTAWKLGRRLGAVGAGTAIVVQGLALFVLELQFAAAVSR
jgi:hypothetical protein